MLVIDLFSRRLLLAILVVGSACSICLALSANTRAESVIGADYSYNVRTGYFDIRGFRNDTALSGMHMWGFEAGRRYTFNHWFRFQLTGAMDWGSARLARIDNVTLTDGSVRDSIAIMDEYFHFGFAPEFHYVFPASEVFAPFLRAGFDLNYMRLTQTGRVLDGGGLVKQQIQLSGEDFTGRTFSAGIHGGVGFDIHVSRHLALTLAYAFHYWHPMAYDYSVDMPLHSVKYWEAFRSHDVHLSLAWGR
jgi:hypothetical protein